MQRRYSLTCLILAVVVVLSLAFLMVCVDVQAQITFMSDRDGHVHPRLGWPTSEIYVMEVDGNNQRRLTNNPHYDSNPEWVNSPFSVSPVGKKFTMWGWLKQLNR